MEADNKSREAGSLNQTTDWTYLTFKKFDRRVMFSWSDVNSNAESGLRKKPYIFLNSKMF